MVDRVPSSGSCARCRRSLGLASVKKDGKWYGSAACAAGEDCPLESRDPAVPEPALYARPRRFFRKRAPKELRCADPGVEPVAPSPHLAVNEDRGGPV